MTFGDSPKISLDMPQSASIFICSNCDAQFQKWIGRCLECGAWGTVAQTALRVSDTQNAPARAAFDVGKLHALDSPEDNAMQLRLSTGIADLDRLFGGGLVPGSLVLLGGEPGIGKSTLVLQLLHGVVSHSSAGASVLYASGEETAEQVAARARRISSIHKSLQFLSATDIDEVINAARTICPSAIIVDSIQTMRASDTAGETGSVTQIKAITAKLLYAAKSTGIPIILIGHVTKDGQVAGPKTLEHLVDTVLYLEGDSARDIRIARAIKNRFGSTNETAVFQMTEHGLEGVDNPSAIFLADRPHGAPGSVIACIMEGRSPLLVEVQSLVNRTVFGYPQRRASGFELNRLQVLIAVLIKRARIPLDNYDVHLNVIGGITINDAAADTAVALAIVSAFLDTAVSESLVAFGEIGLGGELRQVHAFDKRIAEISRMGFTEVLCPRVQKKFPTSSVKLLESANISQAIAQAGLNATPSRQ